MTTRNANRMQEAVETVMARFKDYAGVTITYVNGNQQIAGIVATVGRTPFEVLDGPVMVAHESRDYLIDKADLVTDEGEQWIPVGGHRIVEADGRVYEVAMPKPFNVYESIGPTGTVLKIHTIGPK